MAKKDCSSGMGARPPLGWARRSGMRGSTTLQRVSEGKLLDQWHRREHKGGHPHPHGLAVESAFCKTHLLCTHEIFGEILKERSYKSNFI